jgi:hypothetical protein
MGFDPAIHGVMRERKEAILRNSRRLIFGLMLHSQIANDNDDDANGVKENV